jgi:NCS1 family nucleobase:cation symporter-1
LEQHHSLAVERHSIDFVPISERYGTPLRLFTIWFSTNLSITCAAVGSLGVAAGLGFWWTVAGLALGNAVGAVFMAAHAAQGPQLGVPQMIQSRAQFGVLGAALPLVAVVITFTLYSAANGILIEGTLKALVPVSSTTALLAFGAITVIVAFVGYELIHRMAAVLTFFSTLLFATAGWLFLKQPTGSLPAFDETANPFHQAIFLMTITQAAAWSLSYGPVVADYSRYLPPTVRTATTFWYTGFGCFLGSTLMMAFGAYLAYRGAGLAKDSAGAIAGVFGSGWLLASALILIGVLEGNVMLLYSAYMSMITIVSGLHGMNRIRRGLKLVVMCGLMLVAILISLLAHDNFEAYFADMLNAMIYLLVPWSAINLADYYIVRKGKYVIADLFRIGGIYGPYRWKTIAVYTLGVAVQVPFMNVSFYQGPVAAYLGSDSAWVPGLLVSAGLYIAVEHCAASARLVDNDLV